MFKTISAISTQFLLSKCTFNHCNIPERGKWKVWTFPLMESCRINKNYVYWTCSLQFHSKIFSYHPYY